MKRSLACVCLWAITTSAQPSRIQEFTAIVRAFTMRTPLGSEAVRVKTETAARQLLAERKPDATPEAEWKAIRAAARRALGWVQSHRENYVAAEQEFLAALQEKDDDATVSGTLGMSLLTRQQKTAGGSEEYYALTDRAIFHLMHAYSHEHEGRLNLSERSSLSMLFRKVFDEHYYADADALQAALTLASQSPVPPAGRFITLRRRPLPPR